MKRNQLEILEMKESSWNFNSMEKLTRIGGQSGRAEIENTEIKQNRAKER